YHITLGTLAFGDAFSGELTRTAGEGVGLDATTRNTLTLGSNYALTYTPANFSIGQRPVTVAADAGQSKVYGDADPLPFGYHITLGTLAFGDAFSGELTRTAGEDVGLYAITRNTLTLGSNYALTYTPANFSIGQRPVTVAADAGQSKVYGDADPLPFGYHITLGTLAFGDAFSGELTRTAGEDVGLYAITRNT